MTGINLREERGTKMSLAYEDPTPGVDDDLKDDGALITLAVALEGSFLEGRDCDTVNTNTETCIGNGKRDLKIEDLHDRFDHTSTNRPAETAPERLGFTGALDILTVEEPTTYTSFDWALAQTVTRTQEVLNKFTAP